MIYNRTYIDIINARKIFANKIQKFIELTEAEQEIIDKAYFNLTAINRITNKINEIWELVVDFGGTKSESEDAREWGEQEIFVVTNFSNIRQNISEIIKQLFNFEFVDYESYQNAYNLINDEYIYTNLNNLEKLLYDIDNLLSKMAFAKEKFLYIFGAYNANLVGGELTIE